MTDWFDTAYAGKGVQVREVPGRYGRRAVAFRGWYDGGERMVRLIVHTANRQDRYEVSDLARNWEPIATARATEVQRD